MMLLQELDQFRIFVGATGVGIQDQSRIHRSLRWGVLSDSMVSIERPVVEDWPPGLAIASGAGTFYNPWGMLDILDRKSTRLNSCHVRISYAVFCWKKKTRQ